MRINNLSEEFETYFLHSVISYTFGAETFVGTKSCGEVKLQNLRKKFAKFAKPFVKNNFLSQILHEDFKTLFSTEKNFYKLYIVFSLHVNCFDFHLKLQGF